MKLLENQQKKQDEGQAVNCASHVKTLSNRILIIKRYILLAL